MRLGTLILALLLALPLLMPAATSASAPDTTILKWAIIETPGSTDKNDIRSPCEISAIAVASDGKTIYAVDIPNAAPAPAASPGIWRSPDGGISWSPKPTQHLATATPPPTFPVTAIAVAPDDPNLVAAVCLNSSGTLRREVYISEDGGDNWIYAGAIPWAFGSGEQIGDIAISPGYDLRGRQVHDVIAGSREPADGTGTGEVYILNYPGFGGWKPQGFSGGDVIALHASPSYSTDFTLVVMAATTQRTYIWLGYRDMAANTCLWNRDADWPVELCPPDQCGGTGSGEDRIITGDMALPADFNGNSADKRLIFASYDSNGTAFGTSQRLDDVYRLEDTTVTKLRLPGAGASARISTIAYIGDRKAGKLLAGEVAASQTEAAARVWVCAEPLSACPTWRLALKPPTGGGKDGYANAQLAWTPDGSAAYCGTGSGNRDTPLKWADASSPAWMSRSLDESAVSITEDDGMSWNQVGLIDTHISRFRALAVAEDEAIVYLASVNDNGFDSLWRCRSPVLGRLWQRVMCFSGESPILRLAQDARDGKSVFWGDVGTERARSSADYGQTWHDCLPGMIIQDMAAPDSRTLYVLQGDGEVRRGSYGAGWIWGKRVDSGLNAAHTIAVHKDTVVVGAAAYETAAVAYSADEGRTWTKITEKTPSAGNRHVALDSYFERNSVIYVADDAGGIYRWSLGRSQGWDDLAPPHHSFYGIASGSWGALYGAYSLPQSGVDRALYPRSGIPKPGIYWDSLTTGLADDVKLSTEPVSITISANTLWALDARDYDATKGQGCLWAFTDTLAKAGPRLLEPDEGEVLGCDLVSGRNQDIDLVWEQLSLAEAYELEIAKDAAFSLRIEQAEPETNPYYEPAVFTRPAFRIAPGLLPEAGHTYYWRVRARRATTGQEIRSLWSEVGNFSIRAGFRVVSPYIGAQALSPAHGARSIPVSSVAFTWTPFKGATEYQFVLARDSALSDVIVRETVTTTAFKYSGRLEYDTSYFWQVAATKPVPSEPSPVFSFTTVAEPAPQVPPLPYERMLRWLKISVMVNVTGFIMLAALVIFWHIKRRT